MGDNEEEKCPLIEKVEEAVETSTKSPVKLSTGRTILLSSVLVVAYVSWGALISLIPPFFPSEAEKRGATSTEYGLVFGLAFLAAFLTAPLYGIFGDAIGAKILYNAGGILQGLSGVLLGFLTFVEDKSLFLGLSYALRFIDGAADAAVWNSITSILMVIYPGRVAVVIASGETLFGVGLAIGPVVGSTLYNVGGFGAPFWTVGGITTGVAILMYFLVPNVTSKDKSLNGTNTADTERPISGKPLSAKDIFTSPTILIPCVDTTLVYASVAGVKAMLEVYLKGQLGANQTDVGYAFLMIGAAFTVTSVTAGLIVDKLKYPTIVSIVGNAALAVGLSFVAPASFVSISPSLVTSQAMMAVIGFGQASVMASTFGRSQRAAAKQGFRQDITTYLLISGMWSSALYFGAFIGPTLGGVITDKLGFRTTTTIFSGLVISYCIIDCIELAWNVFGKKTDEP